MQVYEKLAEILTRWGTDFSFCRLEVNVNGRLNQTDFPVSVRIHTTLEKFENAASFIRLGLPSTLIRHENGAFRKRSSNPKNLKTPALRFRVDGKRFENEAFPKR